MPYTIPTPDDIRLDFPLFSAVDEAVIQRRIDRTDMWIDETWMETDYTYAKSLLTAHYLTLDGLGAGTDAEVSGIGLSGVTRLKSGTLDVTFADASGGGAGGSEFDATGYGRRFYALLRKNKSGPLTTGSGCSDIAGAATDVPWAYRGTPAWGL